MAGQGRGSGTPLPPQLGMPAPRRCCQRRAPRGPPHFRSRQPSRHRAPRPAPTRPGSAKGAWRQQD